MLPCVLSDGGWCVEGRREMQPLCWEWGEDCGYQHHFGKVLGALHCTGGWEKVGFLPQTVLSLGAASPGNRYVLFSHWSLSRLIPGQPIDG